MEIPIININPSFVPQALSIFKLSHPHEIWKWGALVLAMLASFTTILNKIKLIILRIQTHFLKTQPLVYFSDNDWTDISDDDESDNVSVSSSVSDNEDDNSDDKEKDLSYMGSASSSGFRWKTTEPTTLMQRGKSFGDLWSELTNAKNVVNLWDNFGLFDYESCDEIEEDETMLSECEFPSGLVLSAAVDDARKAALQVWDTRVGRGIPAILAEWRPQIGKIVGVSGLSGQKVFLRGGGISAVGDMRKLSSPLTNLTESDVDAWWGGDRDSGGSRLVNRS